MKAFFAGIAAGIAIFGAVLLYINHFKPGPGQINQTNVIHGAYIEYFTNAVNLTNYLRVTNRQVITDLVVVFQDYENYSTNDFIFVQSNDSLNVRLWKRSATTKLKSWGQDPRGAISIFYPLGVSYNFPVVKFFDFSIFLGAGYNFDKNNVFFSSIVVF